MDKMKEFEERASLRLRSNEMAKIKQLIRQGSFKSFSQIVREALKEFLQETD